MIFTFFELQPNINHVKRINSTLNWTFPYIAFFNNWKLANEKVLFIRDSNIFSRLESWKKHSIWRKKIWILSQLFFDVVAFIDMISCFHFDIFVVSIIIPFSIISFYLRLFLIDKVSLAHQTLLCSTYEEYSTGLLKSHIFFLLLWNCKKEDQLCSLKFANVHCQQRIPFANESGLFYCQQQHCFYNAFNCHPYTLSHICVQCVSLSFALKFVSIHCSCFFPNSFFPRGVLLYHIVHIQTHTVQLSCRICRTPSHFTHSSINLIKWHVVICNWYFSILLLLLFTI